jgi:acyl-CoA synthetase (AMP-forming)/AMP-acid ligase II
LRAGASLTAAEVIDFCSTYLAGFKCPKHVELVSELPKNASGKVLKTLLRQAS